jgi:hypothetical protein
MAARRAQIDVNARQERCGVCCAVITVSGYRAVDFWAEWVGRNRDTAPSIGGDQTDFRTATFHAQLSTRISRCPEAVNLIIEVNNAD